MLEALKKQVYEANMELPRRGLITYTCGNVKTFPAFDRSVILPQ